MALRLSSDSVMSLAKDVLRPQCCEWGTCPASLNSWRTYRKHIKTHCDGTKSTGFKCAWKSCSFRAHKSLADLISHAELSHLSRVSLPCPFEDCHEMFSRHQLLATHFSEYHSDLVGCVLQIPSPMLRCLARPLACQGLNLRQLPSEPIPCLFFDEVTVSLRAKGTGGAVGSSQSQTLVDHSQCSGKRRRHEKLGRTNRQPSQGSGSDGMTGGKAETDSDDIDCSEMLDDVPPESKYGSEVLIKPVEDTNEQAPKQHTRGNRPGRVLLRKAPESFGFAFISRLVEG